MSFPRAPDEDVQDVLESAALLAVVLPAEAVPFVVVLPVAVLPAESVLLVAFPAVAVLLLVQVVVPAEVVVLSAADSVC